MTETVNPEMIRLAREARGLTQTGLAKSAHLTQATISKVESGVLDVSPAVLSAIAAAVKMPERFFYQTEPIYGEATSEFFHRRRKAVAAGVLTKIHALMNILRIQIMALLRAVDLPPCRIPQLDIEDFKGNPREVARAVRAALNVAPGPIPSIVKVIEDAGGLIIPCAFGTFEIDAISRWAPGTALPLFFANSSAPVDRFRMSIAHELGHMVLHRVPERDMEDQANQFAAEFLMPSAEIKPQLYNITLQRLAALKPYWRTSMAALLKQAGDLQCVTPGTARYLWIQMSQRGYRRHEPAELDLVPERPALLNEIVNYYRADLGYSVDDLAQALKSTPADLMSMYGLELSKPETLRQFRRVK
jgi:Zn-dependent peptidase ImmA (M78 family)/transcriptional regulator with XRE-family HTH domain